MHDGGSQLVVLAPGDPHSGEGGQGGQNGSSNPDAVLSLGWGHHLDLHGRRGKGGDLLGHPLRDVGEHGGSSGKADVAVQVLTDVDLTLHDGVVGEDVDSLGLHSDQVWLEEDLWAPEPLVSDGDDVAIGKLVGFLDGGGSVFLLKNGFFCV